MTRGVYDKGDSNVFDPAMGAVGAGDADDVAAAVPGDADKGQVQGPKPSETGQGPETEADMGGETGI